jgi:hypothetical protein
VEQYIEKQVRKNIPDFDIYNLNTTDELEEIFDVVRLKRELDKDSKGAEQKIYLIGLRFAIASSSNVGFYLNNRPIREQSGVIYGASNILTHKLKRGYMVIRSDEGVEIDFYDTDKFTSKNYDVGSDLEDFDFQDENLSFELERNRPVTIESRVGERLIFSLEQNSAYEVQKRVEPIEIVDRETKLYMNSFFIPRERGLELIKLLLIYKNGKKVLAGGEYHHGLLECDIIGDISIDLEREEITFVNHSSFNLRFINFENSFWRLDESSIYREPEQSYVEEKKGDGGIYTTVLIDDVAFDSDMKTSFDGEEIDGEQDTQTIKQEESFTFKVRELEFNDSNVSFDRSGISISYSEFQIAKFEKEFSLNRTAFKMSNLGTIVDCFVERPKGRDFKWGGKVYESHSDILGRAISSKPIVLKNSNSGLYIESRLDPRYYLLQISSISQKHILEDKNSSVLIPNEDLKGLKMDIINKGYKSRPLVQFSLSV